MDFEFWFICFICFFAAIAMYFVISTAVMIGINNNNDRKNRVEAVLIGGKGSVVLRAYKSENGCWYIVDYCKSFSDLRLLKSGNVTGNTYSCWVPMHKKCQIPRGETADKQPDLITWNKEKQR